MTRYDVDIFIFPGGSHPNVLCKFFTAIQYENVKHSQVSVVSPDVTFWYRHFACAVRTSASSATECWLMSGHNEFNKVFFYKSAYLGMTRVLSSLLLCRSISLEQDLNKRVMFFLCKHTQGNRLHKLIPLLWELCDTCLGQKKPNPATSSKETQVPLNGFSSQMQSPCDLYTLCLLGGYWVSPS